VQGEGERKRDFIFKSTEETNLSDISIHCLPEKQRFYHCFSERAGTNLPYH